MSKLMKYELNTIYPEVKQFIRKQVRDYLESNPENETEVFHIVDYLNEYDKKDMIKVFTYDKAKKRADKWTSTLIQKGLTAVETEEDVEVVKDFGEGMRLVKLIGKDAFDREGSLMSHCVSSYQGKSNHEVYSLRDKFNKPHVTMSIVNNDKGIVDQIKGKGNGKIHPKYISYVIKILNYFNIEIRKGDMINLGYIAVSDKMFNELTKVEAAKKYITIRNQSYIYLA